MGRFSFSAQKSCLKKRCMRAGASSARRRAVLKEDATPWTHHMSSVRLDESAGRGAVAQLEEHCLLSDSLARLSRAAGRGLSISDPGVAGSSPASPPVCLVAGNKLREQQHQQVLCVVAGWRKRHLAGFMTRSCGFDSRPCDRCPRGGMAYAAGSDPAPAFGLQVRILPGVLGSGLSP